MADRSEVERLARRAASGDVESARRLLARLEAESKGLWAVVSEPPGRKAAIFVFEAAGEDDLWRHVVSGPGLAGHSLGAFSPKYVREWKIRAFKVVYEAPLSERLEALAAGGDRGLTLESDHTSAEASATASVPADCHECGGTGSVAGDRGCDWYDCPRCRGTGRGGP